MPRNQRRQVYKTTHHPPLSCALKIASFKNKTIRKLLSFCVTVFAPHHEYLPRGILRFIFTLKKSINISPAFSLAPPLRLVVLCNCTRPSCPIKCGHARTGQVGGGNRTLAKQVTIPDEPMVAACGFRWNIFHQFTCTNESWTRLFIEHFPLALATPDTSSLLKAKSAGQRSDAGCHLEKYLFLLITIWQTQHGVEFWTHSNLRMIY